MKCILCGANEELNYIEETRKELEKHQLCFECNHWVEIIGNIDTLKRGKPIKKVSDVKNIWITKDYRVYYVGEMKDITKINAWVLGHGGRHFLATLQDGTEEESNEIWNVGNLPERFRDRVEVNVNKLTNK